MNGATFKDGLSSLFGDKGALFDVKSWATSTKGALTIAGAATFAYIAALKALDKQFSLTYKTGLENTTEHVEKVQSTSDEIDNLNSKAEEYKQTLTSMAEKYNIQVDGTETVSELVDTLKSVDQSNFSLIDQSELDKISTANDELQTTLTLKQNLLTNEQKEAADDAKKTLDRGVESEARKYKPNTSDGKNVKYAEEITSGVFGANKTGILNAVDEDVKALEEYKKGLKEAQKIQEANSAKPNSKKYKDATKDIKEYTDSISDIEKGLSEKQADLSTLLSAFSVDGKGVTALKGYEEQFKAVKQAINDINNIDLSPSQKKLKVLDDFFKQDSNKLLKEKLQDAAKNGEDLNSVLGKLGIKLSDLGDGLNSKDLSKYFKDLEDSANNAADAVNKVNNNLTMSDVEEAFNSANAGDDYVSLGGYMDKAYELYKQGLTGTDDFKSVAEAISYNIDSSTESFKKNYDRLQRYFTKDDDGNFTSQGVSNFLTDLQGLGKGYAKWNDESGKWELNMSNTAQAAKDMNMSVQSFEALLGRIQDYDNVGDFKFESAIKQFEEAKTSLSGLQKIYDEMDKGEEKDALKLKLDKWEPQIEAAEDDLASIPKEVITQLKFEYDKAQLQQEAQKATDDAKNSGYKDVVQNGTAITATENYQDKLKENIDLSSIDTQKIPVYFDMENAKENLRNQLESGDLSEKETVQVQAELINLGDAQNQLLEAFSNAHPEITPETNTEEATKAFNDWLDSEDGKQAIVDITGDNQDAIDKIKELVDPEYNTEVKVTADDEATPTLEEALSVVGKIPQEVITELMTEDNASPEAIDLISTLTGIPEETLTQINASDGASGVLAYVISQITGVPQDVVTNLLAQDNTSAVASLVTGSIHGVPTLHKTNLKGSDNVSSAASSAKASLSGVTDRNVTISASLSAAFHSAVAAAKSAIASIGGGGGLIGTAHLSGTAFASGTIEDTSFINPKWKTPQSQIALTGEVGQELVVYGNKWWTVGDHGAEFAPIPSGAVIFNSKQTKELFANGFTNSRGAGNPVLPSTPAFLHGTAFLGSSTGGFSFSGGASNYNRGGSSTSYNSSGGSSGSSGGNSGGNTNNNSNTSSIDKATENFTDWIKVLMDRTSRITDLAVDAIDRAIGLIKKQTASANAISKVQNEISVAQKAANKYKAYADQVSLSEDYKRKVRNGELSIENVTDENTRDAVSKYQER